MLAEFFGVKIDLKKKIAIKTYSHHWVFKKQVTENY
jgi:hypothetical protein